MNSSLPIGVFDSGVGGLTVLAALQKQLPHESFIYFGDTARVPYGNRSAERIIQYASEGALFLAEKGAKIVVVACHTVSAFALKHLEQLLGLPVVGVVQPGAEKACETSSSGAIGVIGTRATIHSGIYQAKIQSLNGLASVTAHACPLLVPLVEEQLLHHAATQLILRDYLLPFKQIPIDTLLLGCTHYPFLQHLIQQELGSEIALVDSAFACAEAVGRILKAEGLSATASASPSCQYYVSDEPTNFCQLASTLFGGCSILCKQVNLQELLVAAPA